MPIAAFVFAALVAAAPLGEAPADQTAAKPRPPQASIPFANTGGIRNWTAVREEGEDILYVEGRRDRWYRVDLFGYCPDLRFATAIGFRTGPVNVFDQFSSVVVGHDVCRVASVTQSPPPAGFARKVARAGADAGRDEAGKP